MNQWSIHSELIHLKTKGGLRLAANYFKKGHKKAVVIAHGFIANKDTFLFRRLSEELSEKYDVIILDFRGHGESQGRFTFTSRETEDLVLFLKFARSRYERVGLLGFSLGAAISILVCAETEGAADCLVVVSAPATFGGIDKAIWKWRAFEELCYNLGRGGKGKGARVGNPFLPKRKPIDWIHHAPPVLFLHGTHDWLVGIHHSEKLFKAAKHPKAFKSFEGGYHAERLFEQFPEDFSRHVTHWFETHL